MKIRSLMMAVAVAATGLASALVSTTAQAQAKEQFFPVLPYRTGAYAPVSYTHLTLPTTSRV